MIKFNFNNCEDHKINFIDITVSCWSPKLDLIAIGSSVGEVCLYRLQMMLIWKIVVKNEGKVTTLCWHPDGNILSVGFESGRIQYYSIFYTNCLYSIKYSEPIIYMQWFTIKSDYDKEADASFFKDIFPSRQGLHLNTSRKEKYSNLEEILKLKQKFNILLGVSGKTVFLLDKGVFSLGNFSIFDKKFSVCRMFSMNLSQIGDRLDIIFQGKSGNEKNFSIFKKTINCDYLKNNVQQISRASSLLIDILYLRLVAEQQFYEIEEKWEDCFNLLDVHLIKYSNQKKDIANWSLKSDFMEVILFGCCNKQFWSTLEQSIPIAELKKISDKMTKMSENIISHCCPSLHLTLLKFLFFVVELKNLMLFPSEYEFLGSSRRDIIRLMNCCSSALFMLHDFQIIMLDNVDDLKLFFGWLISGIESHTTEADNVQSFSYSELKTILEFVTEKLQAVKNCNDEIVSYTIKALDQYLLENGVIGLNLNENNSRSHTKRTFDLSFIKELTGDDGDDENVAQLKIDGFFKINEDRSLNYTIKTMIPDLLENFLWKSNISRIACEAMESVPMPLIEVGVNNGSNDVHLISETYLSELCNGSIEVTAFYNPFESSLLWLQHCSGTVSYRIIRLDFLYHHSESLKLLTMQFYDENTLFLLVSADTVESSTSNSYIMVLFWPALPQIPDQLFTTVDIPLIFSSCCLSFDHSIDLSSLVSVFKPQSIPSDASRMDISAQRGVMIVFFGKSHERCRIIRLYDF